MLLYSYFAEKKGFLLNFVHNLNFFVTFVMILHFIALKYLQSLTSSICTFLMLSIIIKP